MIDSFRKIKLVLMDLDGVLTNGKLLIYPDGNWIREMDIKDGYAIQYAVKSGLTLVVVTGSSSSPVKERLATLGVNLFFENITVKSEKVKEILQDLNIEPEQAIFIGDDIPDLDAFALVGLRACPDDAVQDVKAVADYISPYKGGNGCVRDILEKILRVQDKWLVQNHIRSI
jgi:3-deoxy-D-manno-octulosonate 8-phosphate phosphatase (KDO 8-P phosphatase)